MTSTADVFRTPDERFTRLTEYDFEPRYLDWDGLRLHYLDEGPREAPVMLLLHGEPTWAYLYHSMIPPLVEAGYRCIAPDYVGFGRSDKVTDESWYVIERHVESIRFVITELDLRDMTLVCQDWGGPIGLRHAVDMPERFARLAILNTWLHHDGYTYTDTIRFWREASQDPDQMGGDMPVGRIVSGNLRRDGHDRDAAARAYDAPFPNYESKAGARRFPWLLPFAQPEEGNRTDQMRCFDALTRWDKPAHLIFGDADAIFTIEWAREWASRIPGTTVDGIAGAAHFVQHDAGPDVVDTLLRRINEEAS